MKVKSFDKYYVVLRKGEALTLGPAGDEAGKEILWSGVDITLFKSKREAQNAMNRTVRWGTKMNYAWGDRSLYCIVTARTVAE